MSLTSVEIPDSLLERVQQIALEQQVTIGQFIAAAIAEKRRRSTSRVTSPHAPTGPIQRSLPTRFRTFPTRNRKRTTNCNQQDNGRWQALNAVPK